MVRQRAEKIKENLVAHRSALVDVFASMVEPLSIDVLRSTTTISDSDLAAAVAATTPSMTLSPSLTIYDYDVPCPDDQVNTRGDQSIDGDVASFIDFESEELGTTP